MKEVKICNYCNIPKPISEFHKMKGGLFGVRNKCKECRKIERKEYASRPYVKENQRRYYQDNKEDIRKRLRLHYHTLNGQFHQYKKRAKKSNILFKITQKDCEIFYRTNCYYCGDDIKDLGIDRLDSSKGYTLENSVPCCSKCNFMKHTLGFEEFKLQILKIVNKLNLK